MIMNSGVEREAKRAEVGVEGRTTQTEQSDMETMDGIVPVRQNNSRPDLPGCQNI